MSQSSKVWLCDIWKCHKMSQNFTLFQIFGTKLLLPFMFEFDPERLWQDGYIPDTGKFSDFWISFVPGTHFYRQKTKYTKPAAKPVPTTSLAEFSGFLLKKNTSFSVHIIRYLLRYQSDTIMPFPSSIFVEKTTGCQVLAANYCFYGQKWTVNEYLVKIMLTDFKLKM